MAKIDWKSPIEAIHGKLFKGFGAAKRSEPNNAGEQPNFTVFYGKRKAAVTTDEGANRTRFKTLLTMYNARRANSTQRVSDQNAFKAQSQYKTLKAYVWSVCMQTLDAQSDQE